MKKLLLLFIFYSIGIHAQDSIKKANYSVISLDKVKVVYRGIDNPITIAIPDAKSYTVSGAGVHTTNEKGKYIVRPGSGKELTIKVEIILHDDSVIVEEHVYLIENISAPYTTLNGYYNYRGEILNLTLEELKDAKVDVILGERFLFKTKVNRFNIKFPGHSTIEVEGNTFTNEVLDLLNKVKKKDIIVISDVNCTFYGYQGHIKMPSLIVFKIIKE